MICRKWDGSDPAGWMMSEKHDGIRFLRQKGSQTITTREGNEVRPPKWWVDQLPPDIFLDGEADCGRGQFEKVQSIVQGSMQKKGGDEWRQMKLMVIEPMGLHCMAYASVLAPIVQIVCRGYDHLQSFYDDIVNKGGEGVVLRHPNHKYHLGYSPYMVKVKPELKGTATFIRRRQGIPEYALGGIAALDKLSIMFHI